MRSGLPPLPMRLVAGLFALKHMLSLSDGEGFGEPYASHEGDCAPCTRAEALELLVRFGHPNIMSLRPPAVFSYFADGWLADAPRGGDLEIAIIKQLHICRVDFVDWLNRSRASHPKFWCEPLTRALPSPRNQHNAWIKEAQILAAMDAKKGTKVNQSDIARRVKKRLGLSEEVQTVRTVLNRSRRDWLPSDV